MYTVRDMSAIIHVKKFLSAAPGVGRFLLSKFFYFNLYSGKYCVKKKVCHTKVVGIERTFPMIPHMIYIYPENFRRTYSEKFRTLLW